MRNSYRWRDYVITPARSQTDLIATILCLAIVGVTNLEPSRHSGNVPNRAEIALSVGRFHALPDEISYTCEQSRSRISSPST